MYMQKHECVTEPLEYNFPGIKRKDQYLCLIKWSKHSIQKEESEFLWKWIQYHIFWHVFLKEKNLFYLLSR